MNANERTAMQAAMAATLEDHRKTAKDLRAVEQAHGIE